MIRLFVALPLPEAVRGRLAALGAGVPNARWVSEGNMHLTLRFIGEVDETTAEEIHDHLTGVRGPRFDLRISGCGAFGDRQRVHTLWAGVEREPALVHLRDKVESAVVRAGRTPEGRRYSPHITLARLRDAPAERVQRFVQAHNLLNEVMPIDRFVLFSSRLGHGEPVYAAVAEYPLG